MCFIFFNYFLSLTSDFIYFLSKYEGQFYKTRANPPKMCMEPQKAPKSQSNLEKCTKHNTAKAGCITCSNLKLYYKAMVIKIVWHWHKIRHIDNRTQSPHINLCIYSQIFYRRNQQLGKDSLFNK